MHSRPPSPLLPSPLSRVVLAYFADDDDDDEDVGDEAALRAAKRAMGGGGGAPDVSSNWSAVMAARKSP